MKTHKKSIPIASVLLVIAITLSACQATELSETDIAPTVEILGPKIPIKPKTTVPPKHRRSGQNSGLREFHALIHRER
jgi:hypothetical protein